jgi:hypothetical protein
MRLMMRMFAAWLPHAFVITGLCGTVYVVVHQNYRQLLNDPQIQMAEDAARFLARGVSPDTLVAGEKIDMAESLAPYVVVYSEDIKPLASSVLLDGEVPTPPEGVFAYAQSAGEDRISWEPRPGVRSTIVVRPWREAKAAEGDTAPRAGFVLVGRSMRESEQRERRMGLTMLAAWAALMAGSFVLALCTALARRFFDTASFERMRGASAPR